MKIRDWLWLGLWSCLFILGIVSLCVLAVAGEGNFWWKVISVSVIDLGLWGTIDVRIRMSK